MTLRRELYLWVAALTAIAFFLGWGLDADNWRYFLSRRLPKVGAIIVAGGSTSIAALLFQTITNNRILTPGVMGLDAMYMMIQTIIVFFGGGSSIVILNQTLNFGITSFFMVLFALGLFSVLLGNRRHSIYFLLLVGIVFGILFRSVSSYLQMVIDPNEFSIVQDSSFASFNNTSSEIFRIGSLLVAPVLLYVARLVPYLDVLWLGRDGAVNLGVSYQALTRRLFAAIAVLVSVATALVGPVMFLGLLVVNLTREIVPTHRHRYLLPDSVLITTIILVAGQFLVERLLTFAVPLSILINFAGGAYFLYLLLKGKRT